MGPKEKPLRLIKICICNPAAVICASARCGTLLFLFKFRTQNNGLWNVQKQKSVKLKKRDFIFVNPKVRMSVFDF